MWDDDTNTQMQVNLTLRLSEYTVLECNSVFYKMVKSVCNVIEFTKSMLYNCTKVVRLKPDQPNQWLRACAYIW